MNLEFVKTVQFTLLIKAGGRIREFNFRQLKKALNLTFSTDVSTERNERIVFTIENTEEKWRFSPHGLPTWITENEKLITESVEMELKNW